MDLPDLTTRRGLSALARGLARELQKDRGLALGHGHALDLVARALGVSGGNALMGHLKSLEAAGDADRAITGDDHDNPVVVALRPQLAALVRDGDAAVDMVENAPLDFDDEDGVAVVAARARVAFADLDIEDVVAHCRHAQSLLEAEDLRRLVAMHESGLTEALDEAVCELAADEGAAAANAVADDADDADTADDAGGDLAEDAIAAMEALAAEVNNGGPTAQLEWLLERATPGEVFDLLFR